MAHQLHHIKTSLHGRYLTRPAPPVEDHGWVIGFHGYGESAETHMERLGGIPAPGWNLCAVQALHRFYNRSGSVVASWMTKEDRELAIDDNVNYVDLVVNEIVTPKQKLVFLGFSQGAAMAYRAAFLGRRTPDMLIVIGGDMPPELPATSSPDSFPILICRGTNDPHYSEAQLAEDDRRLRQAGAALNVLTYAGEHDWTTELGAKLGEVLAKHPLRP